MTKEEALAKIISKAVANGYKGLGDSLTDPEELKGSVWIHQNLYKAIVFSKYFAKAFCKGIDRGIIAKGNSPEHTFEEVGEPHEWFLQQMALEEDPIQYLAKFLD